MQIALALLVLCFGFHHVLSQDINLSSWMTDMWSTIGTKPLASVWIPGSHDSGTFDLGDNSYDDSCDQSWFSTASSILPASYDLIKKLSIAQMQSLTDQATSSGIRYFDLRLYAEENQAFFVHCMLSNNTFETYLADLARSIHAQPDSKEVYILNFYSFVGPWNAGQHQAVVDKVVAMFNGSIATGVTPTTTLNQIVGAGGPKVILLWNKDFTNMTNAEYLTAQGEWLQRPYDGVNCQDALLSRNAGYYAQYASVISDNSRVFVMESVMTAQAGDISGIAADLLIFGDEVTSELIKWESGVNWAIMQYMYANWVGASKSGMIVMIDDTRYTYADDIVKANLPVAPSPVMWSFGSCSASYNWLSFSCGGSNPDGCAPGYSDHNYYASGICYCKCCRGNDCGCDAESQTSCR